MQRSDRLQRLWESPAPLWGGWCSIPSPHTAEVMARSGFDWISLDAQHALIADDALDAMLDVAWNAGTPAFVRVPAIEPHFIGKVLDGGASGVIVPMVSSVEDARRAVAAVRYPPRGNRSWGGMAVRAARRDPAYSPDGADRAVKCVVMIETVEGCERADEILAVDGIDAVLVGPADLALSAGLPTSAQDEPAHLARIEAILTACRKRRVVPGIFAGEAERARRWAAAGFRFIGVADDVQLLSTAASSAVAVARG